MLASTHNKQVVTCRRSLMAIAVSVSMLLGMRSPHPSTSFHDTFGATSVSSLHSLWYNHMLTSVLGIMWAYILFNFAVVFVCTWLYLGGLRKIKSKVSPAARKQKKEQKQKQSGDET
jgi:hypothetical protein